MPGVDVAITPFPEREEQRRLVEEALTGTVQSALCVLPQGADSRVQLVLDNGGAGHGFPSGATSDRRFWAEVTAEQGGVPLYSSGVLPEGTAVAELSDPDLWLVRSCLYDEAGREVHQFWEAHEKVSNTLPTMETLDPTDPRYYGRHRSFDYPGPGRVLGGEPDVVRVRLWMEPIGREVLHSLVESGDLAPEHAAAMPTLPVGPVLEWRADGPRQPWIDPVTGEEGSCVTDTGIELRAARTAAKSHAKCERE